MPYQNLHLRSSVQGKEPVAGSATGQLPVGSIGINFNAAEPFLTIQDSAGAIRRIAGVAIGTNAPATPTAGEAWLDTTIASKPIFKLHDGTNWVVAGGSGADAGGTAPVAPLEGDLWVDTSVAGSPVLKVYNGTAWVVVTPDATTTVKGIVQLADAAAVTAGTAGRVVDAAQLKVVKDAIAGDATTTSKGVVQLADAAAVTAGTAGRIVDAAQLKVVSDAVAAEDLWDRAGTEISPKTAGDSVFTSGEVKVGNTTAAPNLQIKADGGIVANTTGLVYDAATKRLGIGTTSPSQPFVVSNGGAAGLEVDPNGADSGSTIQGYNRSTSAFVPITMLGSHLAFRTGSSPTEKARIDSSGRLLVGTSTGVATNTAEFQGNSFSSSGPANVYIKLGATNPSSGTAIGNISFSDSSGAVAGLISCASDGTWGSGDHPGRLVFGTTAAGASTSTERMRISSAGALTCTAGGATTAATLIASFVGGGIGKGVQIYEGTLSASANAANSAVKIGSMITTNRSLSAAGTVNASGADYAEYMAKAGDFVLAKGAICGIDSGGKLTNVFSASVGFVVKSTNPSYVGGDNWGAEDVLGSKPSTDDPESLAQWEAKLEAERQKVDRIAFAGQVPVNVMGATPGQYIVPVEDNAGISGIAKDEADLTLAEYMRAVGKVIAIEDDGRARIIVKVA